MKRVVLFAVFLAVTFAQQDETTLSLFDQEATTPEVNPDILTPTNNEAPLESSANPSPTEIIDSSSSDESNSSPQVDGSLVLAGNPETQDQNSQANESSGESEVVVSSDHITEEPQVAEILIPSSEEPQVSAGQSETEPSSQSSFEIPQKILDEPEPTTPSQTLSQSESILPQEASVEPEPVVATNQGSEGSEISQESLTPSQQNSAEPTESSVESRPPNQSQSISDLSQESFAEPESSYTPQSSFELPLLDSRSAVPEDQPNKSVELETVRPASLEEINSQEPSTKTHSEEPIIEERYDSSSVQSEAEKSAPSSEIPPVTIVKTEVTTLLPSSPKVAEYRPFDIDASTTKRPPPSFLQRSSFARYLTSRAPPTTSQPTTQAPRFSTTTSRPYTPIVNHISSEDQNAKTLYYENEIRPDGSYKYAFETSNGIAAQAEGTPRTYDGEPPYTDIVASGAFSWLYPDGKKIYVKYTADENGYHPEGDSLPTPPPIPDQIARALEWVRKVTEERKSRQLLPSKE